MTSAMIGTSCVFSAHLFLFFTSPSFSAFYPAFLKMSLGNKNAPISLECLKAPQIVKKLLFMEFNQISLNRSGQKTNTKHKHNEDIIEV